MKTIQRLFLLWMMASVVEGQHLCPMAQNFWKLSTSGEFKACIPCPECPEGNGLNIQCGSLITDDTKIECVQCKENVTYSNSHGVESCKPCQDCGLRNVLQECTSDQNRKCGRKCPKGHYLDDNGFCQECYFCCPSVDETGRMKKCKEIGMGEDWQCLKNHQNKLCKEALENSTEASVDTTHATAVTLLPDHNFEANKTESTSGDNVRKPTVLSLDVTLNGNIKPSILVGMIILIALVLIFAVYGVKRIITSRNGSALYSEDNREDEHEQFLLRQPMNNRPNIGLIPTDCDVSEMFTLCNNENELMLHNIQDMLDPDLPGKKGWREVGRHLKVTERDLNLLKLQYKSNGSPTEGLIEKLKTFTPEPSMKEFVEALISCERSDEANYICNWPWEKRNCTELENHEQPDTVQQPEMVKQLA
nr:uncharacterized protein LOC131785017 [Pocillopora verrucosa]